MSPLQRLSARGIDPRSAARAARINSGADTLGLPSVLLPLALPAFDFSACGDEAEEETTQVQRRFASLRRVDSHRDRLGLTA